MIILIGASASGKTVIGKYLIDTYKFNKFVTTTTREMRVGEKNDVDYHFVSIDEFLKRIKNNAFVEFVQYNNHYYGSQKSEIDNNKVLIIEAKGLDSYLNLKDKNIVTFYFECSEDIRKSRMIERGDNIIDIEKRLKVDKELFSDSIKKKVDYIINSENKKIEEIGDYIYKLYKEKMEN